MCWQIFEYFACGHDRICQKRCGSAPEHHFFMLISCGEYTSTSTQYDHQCGLGRFYCAHDKDARFLDLLHKFYRELTKAVVHADYDLTEAQAAVDQSFERAEGLEIPRHIFLMTPQYMELSKIRDRAGDRIHVLKRQVAETTLVISQAKYQFGSLGHDERLGDGIHFPTLTLAPWMMSLLRAEFASSSGDPSNSEPAHRVLPLQHHHSVGFPPAVTKDESDQGHANTSKPITNEAVTCSPGAPEAQNTHQPKRSQKLSTIAEGSATEREILTPVRRSLRTTIQPDSYDEDALLPSSRSTSPSRSPTQLPGNRAHPSRGRTAQSSEKLLPSGMSNASVMEKIKEWRKRFNQTTYAPITGPHLQRKKPRISLHHSPSQPAQAVQNNPARVLRSSTTSKRSKLSEPLASTTPRDESKSHLLESIHPVHTSKGDASLLSESLGPMPNRADASTSLGKFADVKQKSQRLRLLPPSKKPSSFESTVNQTKDSKESARVSLSVPSGASKEQDIDEKEAEKINDSSSSFTEYESASYEESEGGSLSDA